MAPKDVLFEFQILDTFFLIKIISIQRAKIIHILPKKFPKGKDLKLFCPAEKDMLA